MADLAALADQIKSAVADSAPVAAVDGGFVRAGYDGRRKRRGRRCASRIIVTPATLRSSFASRAARYNAELDRLRSLQENGERHIVALQNQYRTETGVGSLKIRQNRVLGYFIDVPTRGAEMLSENPAFRRTQTLMDRQRFVTQVRRGAQRSRTTPAGGLSHNADGCVAPPACQALLELERDISQANSRALVLELEIYDQLCSQVRGPVSPCFTRTPRGAEPSIDHRR